MKPTKYGTSFGDNTHSVVFELSAPGEMGVKSWLGSGSVRAVGTSADDALRVTVAALRKLADELEGEAAPSQTSLAFAREMAAGEGAPPMTDADVVDLAHKVDASHVAVVEAKATTPCVDCSKPAVALRAGHERLDPVCADHY